MLNLYKLEIFNTVVQAGSFSGAAERLLLTQPAVSQHIQDLEAGLGTPLFHRSRRGVELTDAGATLHRYARAIFSLVAEAEAAVTDVRNLNDGQVRVGATPGAGVYLLPDWVQAFRSRYPKLSVMLRTGVTSEVVADLRQGRLELAFVEGEVDVAEADALRLLAVRDEEQFVVVGRKHPWWGRTETTPAALAGQTWIVRQRNSQTRIWLDETLQRHGIQPAIGAEFDSLESIKRAVALGGCLTVLPEYVMRAELEMGSLHAIAVEGRPFQRTLKLLWNPALPWTPVARAFLRSLTAPLPALATLLDKQP